MSWLLRELIYQGGHTKAKVKLTDEVGNDIKGRARFWGFAVA
jgi:hypothetical protein